MVTIKYAVNALIPHLRRFFEPTLSRCGFPNRISPSVGSKTAISAKWPYVRKYNWCSSKSHFRANVPKRYANGLLMDTNCSKKQKIGFETTYFSVYNRTVFFQNIAIVPCASMYTTDLQLFHSWFVGYKFGGKTKFREMCLNISRIFVKTLTHFWQNYTVLAHWLNSNLVPGFFIFFGKSVEHRKYRLHKFLLRRRHFWCSTLWLKKFQ